MSDEESIHIAHLSSQPLVYKMKNNVYQTVEFLDLENERNCLKRVLLKSKLRLRFKMGFASSKTLLDFVTLGCKVVHITGHGQGRGLLLENVGEAHLINREGLKEIFMCTKKTIDLVFIAACKSEKVGEEFVKAGVRHVIATNEVVRDDCACRFMEQFYLALLTKRTVKEAFKSAVVSVATMPLLESKREAKKFVLLPDAGNHDVQIFQNVKKGSPEDLSLQVENKIKTSYNKLKKEAVLMWWHLMKLIVSEKCSVINLYGESGIGKTALVENIALYLAEREFFEAGVFFINFNTEFEGKKVVELPELVAYIAKVMRKDGEECKGIKDLNKLISYLKSIEQKYKKILMIFDGVDNQKGVTTLKNVKSLVEFITNCSKTKALITSRHEVISNHPPANWRYFKLSRTSQQWFYKTY